MLAANSARTEASKAVRRIFAEVGVARAIVCPIAS